MKYEPALSDIMNDKNKYNLTILRMNKKANKGVLFYLIMKVSIYNYIIIHILFIIISSIGLLILCNEFNPDHHKYKYLSNWIRLITPYTLVKTLKISHLTYIIICSVIIVLCLIRNLKLVKLMFEVKKYHILDNQNIKINNFIVIINHIVYIFFSYIVEFLSFIYYIKVIPNNFIIKKDQNISEVINILFCALNGIFIIIYNISNFLFISLINRPTSDKSYPMRIRLPKSKLILFIILQNFEIIHPIQFYLDQRIIKIWCIILNILLLLLFIYLYLISLRLFNYDNICNSIISFIGEFCFISVIIEFILFFFSIKQNNNRLLFYFTLLKIIFTICLYFFLKKIYIKLLTKITRKRLFYNNPASIPFDNNLITSILFLREIIKEKKYSQLNKFIEFFIEHKNQCMNINCGCRIIKININTKIIDKFVCEDNLIKKINYYIETILIKYNYHNNFELSILLSEHYYLFKENYKIAYSILQTLLHYNYKTLNQYKLILLYESMNKYINHILNDKVKKINLNKFTNITKCSEYLNKEIELKHYLYLILKIKKSIKYMVYYSKKFINLIKYKDNYENSNVVKLNEIINEIEYISSPYLNKKNLRKLIDYLSLDEICTSDIKNYLYELKEYNCKLLSYEYLYKIFLFIDFFWNGRIPDNLFEVLYSFASNRSIYNAIIKPEIFQLLEYKLYESLNYPKKNHYLLLKYTKNLKISYISELLSHILKFNKSNLINNEVNAIIIKDLIPFHENVIKEYYFVFNNFILKDKIKFIFDSKGYFLEMIMNSSIQIGINKNILIICLLEIKETIKEIYFYANKNLNIISINQSFKDNLGLSLSLIEEFKIEIKDLFGIDIKKIEKNYKNEMLQLKNIKEYKAMNTTEYVIKNLFKNANKNKNFHIVNKLIINENDNSDSSDCEGNEKKTFINKDERYKNRKFLNNLYNNIFPKKIHFFPIKYEINKENYLLNLRNIIEKIKAYEKDKLENKNIYNDYLKLINKYKQINNNLNIFYLLYIEPRVLDDTIFYFCQVKQYVTQNILGTKYITPYYNINTQNEADEVNLYLDSTNEQKNKVKEFTKRKSNISIIYKNTLNEEIKNEDYDININSKYYKEKIKKNKTSKYRFWLMLLLCSIALLISCIIKLNYQTSLVHKKDKIFDALYYNYYQRTQFIYLNSIILSIYYELINITNFNLLEENKYILNLIGKNIIDSHQLFFNYYVDFKIELNENFTKLYEPLLSNKITINWENKIFHNDYNTEIALIVFRIFDVIKHDFNDDDKKDCQNFLFGKFLIKDRKKTPVNGNFIKLLYFFYANYDTILSDFFLELENSYDISLNNFSKATKFIYIILEVIAILSFHAFFFVNLFFLLNSNKYIFQNILYMFLDFTQTEDNYSFNNKADNLLAIKRMSNYIILLNEFNPKNLNSLKYNKENRNIEDLKYLENEDNLDYSINDSKIKSRKAYKIIKANRKGSSEKVINTSLFKPNAQKDIIGEINNKNLNKNGKNNDSNNIHFLNNENLNNISNNSMNNLNNSKNNSTNLFLNTSNEHDNRKSTTIFNDELKINKEKEESLKLTFEIILFQTRITMLYSIKIIIIIFSFFIFIFIIYFIYKLILSLLFISNFKEMISDFKELASQYNNIILYWNKIETLFIMPNTTTIYNLNRTETNFYELNNRVYNIYNSRIKRYKKISILYDILLGQSSEKNLSTIEFCLGHSLCNQIKMSSQFLLSNGIESSINLCSKEIYNYYKIYLLLRNNITKLNDIQYLFSDKKYKILNTNLNHIFIFLEEIFFKFFLEDEKNIVNNFYLTIKIINIIEICYCLLLNLFSVFFIYPFIMRIVSFVENASSRINCSLCRMKIYI